MCAPLRCVALGAIHVLTLTTGPMLELIVVCYSLQVLRTPLRLATLIVGTFSLPMCPIRLGIPDVLLSSEQRARPRSRMKPLVTCLIPFYVVSIGRHALPTSVGNFSL